MRQLLEKWRCEMSIGSINEVLFDTIKRCVNQWKNDGLTNEEIATKIYSINLEEILQEVTDTASKDFASFFKEKMFEIELEERANTGKFLAHQEELWGKCFAASQTMYTITLEAAENISEYIDKNASEQEKDDRKYTFLALKHIHGRACQIFLEILTLIRNGFGDCAYARWRSLYELNCIAYFIKSQGEQIAKQYYEQSQTDDQRYKTWTKGATDNNGAILNIDTFHGIEKYCEMGDIWNKQYKLACLVTHGSPQGTFKRMSTFKTMGVIPVGRSDYGIAVPAEHSAISLHFISALFFNVFPYADSIAYIKTLGEWVHVIQDIYYSTEKAIFESNEKPAD